MTTLARLCAADTGLLATPYKIVNLNDDGGQNEGIEWGEKLTASGGEGMAVKTPQFIRKNPRRPIQPTIKRGNLCIPQTRTDRRRKSSVSINFSIVSTKTPAKPQSRQL